MKYEIIGTLLILYSLGEFFYFFKMDNICETHCRRSQQQQMPSQQQLRMLRQPTKLYRRLPNADQLAEIELRQEFLKENFDDITETAKLDFGISNQINLE